MLRWGWRLRAGMAVRLWREGQVPLAAESAVVFSSKRKRSKKTAPAAAALY
jgi:hypothetical protein